MRELSVVLKVGNRFSARGRADLWKYLSMKTLLTAAALAAARCDPPITMRIGINIWLGRRTEGLPNGFIFLALDGLGLHAGWNGREVAWTREFGWVTG
jgi:hypothetical protein